MRSSLVQGPHRAGKLNILYEEKANVVIFIGASCVCGASYAVPNVIDFSRYDTKCSGETRYCTSPCKFIKTLTKLRIILTSLINVNYKKKLKSGQSPKLLSHGSTEILFRMSLRVTEVLVSGPTTRTQENQCKRRHLLFPLKGYLLYSTVYERS